jgi:tetrahydromethanopterin S-methyltransferase subunit H
MFRLKREQKIYQIDNVKIGGQPGELPEVLIGNIFYKGMPEVTNHKKGNFNKQKVLKWIKLAEKLAEKSGVPHFLDIMSMYPEAITKYITFVVEQSNIPFLIDGANPETRIAALNMVKELGLEKQVIFNGVTPKTSEKELAALKDSNINAAVLMAFNELDYSPEGRISILRDSMEHSGLLNMAEKAGIEKVFIDTIVFDVPSISYAAEAIKLVKSKLGLPAGCSPANATYAWKQALKESVLSESFAAANTSAHTIAQCWGADFLIYGPIKQAKNMIPACAINDAIIAYYNMKNFGIKPLVKDHPLYKVL